MADDAASSKNTPACLGNHKKYFQIVQSPTDANSFEKCYIEEIPSGIINKAGLNNLALALRANCNSGRQHSALTGNPVMHHNLVVINPNYKWSFIFKKCECDCAFEVHVDGNQIPVCPNQLLAKNADPVTFYSNFKFDEKAINLSFVELGEDESESLWPEDDEKKKLMVRGLGTIRISLHRIIEEFDTSLEKEECEISNEQHVLAKIDQTNKFISCASKTPRGVNKTLNVGMSWETKVQNEEQESDNESGSFSYELESVEEFYFYYRTRSGYLHEKRQLYGEDDISKVEDKHEQWLNEQRKKKVALERRKKTLELKKKLCERSDDESDLNYKESSRQPARKTTRNGDTIPLTRAKRLRRSNEYS